MPMQGHTLTGADILRYVDNILFKFILYERTVMFMKLEKDPLYFSIRIKLIAGKKYKETYMECIFFVTHINHYNFTCSHHPF
jgi:hypothetical protein